MIPVLRSLTITLISLLAACEESPAVTVDGAGDLRALDVGVIESAVSGVVDFVVQGCEQRTAKGCSGTVPLQLTFSAVLEHEPGGASWDFGDGSKPVVGLVVTHTYDAAGVYDVALTVSQGAGTVSELKPGLVEVKKADSGAACVVDDDCVSGSCVCGDGSCAFPLDGMCLESCELDCAEAKNLCVDMELKGSTAPEPWRTTLCLPGCTTSAECTRPGMSCQFAPGVQGWRKVCLPGTVGFVGEPCRAVDGIPGPALCSGGLCLDIGASGYCSWPCKANTCPDGTRCVQFDGGGAAVCLLRCETGLCLNDPSLACELPGGSGPYAFTILGTQPPAGTVFCSVKRCQNSAECGLSGNCDGGFCRP